MDNIPLIVRLDIEQAIANCDEKLMAVEAELVECAYLDSPDYLAIVLELANRHKNLKRQNKERKFWLQENPLK